MKIAILGNFDKEISPSSSGGTEVFTYSLATALVKKLEKDEIHVYGVGKNYFTDPHVSFRSVLPTGTNDFIESDNNLRKLSKNRGDLLSQFQFNLAIKTFYEILSEHYDLIHDNSTLGIFNSLSKLLNIPILTTLHTNLSSPSILIPYLLGMLKEHNNHYFVTIANHQKKFGEENKINLNIIANIYNGIDVNSYTPNYDTPSDGYGFWIGRISKKHNKGFKETLLVARTVQKPTKLVTQVDDIEYFEELKEYISPYSKIINEKIFGLVKNDLFMNASYFIYPIMWEEPFGLIFPEAMACGTPVIAFARGAVPEIIKDGQTGLIINPSPDDIRGDWIIKKTGIEGLCEAVERIYKMPADQYRQMRLNCRKHVEENFTVERMVNEYEKVYRQIINKA